MNRKTVKSSPPAKNTRKKSGSAASNAYSIIPFVLLVVSIILESCLIFPNGTGAVGQAVHKIMCGAFGAVSYLIPAGILMLAFCFFEIRRNRATVIKIVTLSLFVLFFSACQSVAGDPTLEDTQKISVLFENGVLGVGGGALGGLIGKLLVLAFDKTFSIVLSAVIAVIALSLFIGAKSIGVWHYVFAGLGVKLPKKQPKLKKEEANTEQKAVPEKTAAEPEANTVPVPQTAEPSKLETTISEPEPIKPRDLSNYDPFAYGSSLVSDAPSDAVQLTQPTSPQYEQTPPPQEQKQPERRPVPIGKNGKARAYSPFANPFYEEESSAQPSRQTASQKSNGSSYSPFADPFSSMNDPHPTDRNLPPQSYIACDAEYTSKKAPQPEPASGNDASKKSGILKFLRRPEEMSAKGESEIYTAESPVRTAIPTANPTPQRQSDNQTAAPSTSQTGRVSPEPEKKEPPAITPDYYSPPFDIEEVEEDYEDDEDIEVDQDVMFDTTPPTSNGEEIRQVYGNEPRYADYVYPQFDLLDPPKPLNQISEEEVMAIRNTLLEKLASFRVEATLSGYSVGPTITRYEITPGPGVKVRQITALTEDLALALQSDGVRIAAVSGKSAIGVEVPNEKVSTVSLRALIESREFINAKSRVTVCVGLTVTGKPVYMDIDDMPHVLIAGETKSGKSVAINCMILSLLYRASPDEVQLIMIDPKRVELNVYSKIPHLVMPVIDNPKRAAAALRWAVNEMDRRYMLLDKMGVRNREEYCELRKQDSSLELMPQIIIVIDELADLMLQVREFVEELINRLAAMARACGMHLLVGTQRPSVDIITGLIKANIPARIAFKVASGQDSQIILGGKGAEKLLGRGDMLYQATGAGRMRIQGAFVSGTEIKRLTAFLIEKNGPAEFDPEILRSLDCEVEKMNKSSKKSSYTDDDDDNGTVDSYEPDFDLLCRAIEYILETGKTSTNVIQRVLHVGFNRAADIIDTLEDMGFLSARDGNRPREVQVTWEMYEEWKMRKQM